MPSMCSLAHRNSRENRTRFHKCGIKMVRGSAGERKKANEAESVCGGLVDDEGRTRDLFNVWRSSIQDLVDQILLAHHADDFVDRAAGDQELGTQDGVSRRLIPVG